MFDDRYGLTKAVLSGQKTQTRRVIPQRTLKKIEAFREDYFNDTLDNLEGVPLLEQYFFIEQIGKTKYQKGEFVAMAQSYSDVNKEYVRKFNCECVKDGVIISSGSHISSDDPVASSPIGYWSGNPVCKNCGIKADCFEKYFRFIGAPSFSNKMFVKAELMLHQIRITNIRFQRLQDISDEDCLKEGIIEDCPGVQYSFPTEVGYCGQYPFDTPRSAYAALIDKVSGKETWEKNPFVIVYDFELVK